MTKLIENDVQALESLLDTMEVDLFSDKTFVICGAMKSYTDKEGVFKKGIKDRWKELNSKHLASSDREEEKKEIYKETKKRIGNKFYLYEDATKSIETEFCKCIGLWIPKGYIVVDADDLETSEIILDYLKEKEINTPIIKTPNGYQFIFKYEGEEIKQRVKDTTKLGVKIDYKCADKGYIVLPLNTPNREIFNNNDYVEYIPHVLLPSEEQKVITKEGGPAKKNTSNMGRPKKGNEKIKVFEEGSRNDNLLRHLAGKINEPTFRNRNNMLMYAIGSNFKMCVPPLDIEEVEKIVDSVIEKYTPPSYVGKNQKIVPFKLMEFFCTKNSYKYFMAGDFIYKDNYYQKADSKEIQTELNQYILDYDKDLAKTSTLDETFKFLRMYNLVKSTEKRLYIGFNNGLLNILNGEMKEHTPEEFTLFKINSDFESVEKGLSKYKGSRFEEYLNTTFKYDYDLIQNVKEIFGASLLPNPNLFQRMVLLEGKGSNGKSAFIKILKALHGGNVSAVALKNIDQKAGQNFDLYNMVGKNINIDDDASGSRLESTENLKKITTGGPLQLVKKNEQGITDELPIMLISAINNLPSSVDKSEGFFRRFMMIPFKQRFYKPGDLDVDIVNDIPVDFNLESDIINNEMDIVVAFALEGLKTMLENNYQPTECKAVKDALIGYKKTTDSIYDFYEANKDGTYKNDIMSKDLYRYYVEWCEKNNHISSNNHTFGKDIKNYVKESKRITAGIIYYGVRTNTPVERDFGQGSSSMYSKKIECPF